MANDDYREILETKRVEIVKGINCDRPLLLDYLRSKQVLDQTDCELIRAANTNDARVGKLIDILRLKEPEAYQYFLDVVQLENPALYESLTGEKASSKPSPLMRQLAFPDIRPGELSQLQPLVEYQQRMLQDLTDSAQRLREVLKANEVLEQRLESANKDLECEKQRRQDYENRLQQQMQVDESLEKSELVLFNEYDKMEKGIADRDVYIIMLQMKLLAEKEESEKLKMKVEEIEHKNEKMARELRRVSQNYNQERCQSIKLSECIRIQGDEIQKVDELRKQLRECKYKNIIVTEERDGKIQELMELKKWTEALKTRFDVIEKERQTSKEKTEAVSNNCVFLQESVRTLNQKLSTTNFELEEMRKRHELLTKDCNLFKTQRNYALEARREAVNSRDKLVTEKDEIQAQCYDLLAKQQKMNEEKADLIQSCDSLHIRYEKTSQELTRLKTALNEKEMEVDDLKRRLKEANDQNRRSTVLLDSMPGMSDSSDDDDEHDTSGSLEPSDETADADKRPAVTKRTWRERRMQSFLKSIKVRIAGERVEDNQGRDHVNLAGGNYTLDVLQQFLPNLSMRPSSSVDPVQVATLSRTIQRQMCLRGRKMTRGLHEDRARTAPNPLAHDASSSDDEVRNSIKQARSTPDLTYPDDINKLPGYFRERSRNVTRKDYRRANSSH